MIILDHPDELNDFLQTQRLKRQTIGFVPTMGALHTGHLELMKVSAGRCDVTVVSIFVNPTQFNNASDFRKYPATMEKDLSLLEKSSVDVLFSPSVATIYPQGTTGLETYDLGYLETVLEGRYRPGHFQGVCQVMSRLLRLVRADFLFMGQKDYQQCMVVRRLIPLINVQTELVTCPTVREPDGLAMSSRNLRLDAGQRKNAVNIHKTLEYLRQNIHAGDLLALKQRATRLLEDAGFRVDYVEIADAATLQPLDSWDGSRLLIGLIAAFLGEVRLIDNLALR